eukprot:1156896-Pelagomonas_calceolata.AAC.5
MAGCCISPNAWYFHSISFALISFIYKDSRSLKITQICAVGRRVWRLGGQKVGFAPQQIRHAQHPPPLAGLKF